MRSVEADIVIPGNVDGARADLVDASIGEASTFHETFGFCARGDSIDTAVLADGWEDRLVRYETPATNGVVAWCLSPKDHFVSKAIAGRPKDLLSADPSSIWKRSTWSSSASCWTTWRPCRPRRRWQ